MEKRTFKVVFGLPTLRERIGMRRDATTIYIQGEYPWKLLDDILAYATVIEVREVSHLACRSIFRSDNLKKVVYKDKRVEEKVAYIIESLQGDLKKYTYKTLDPDLKFGDRDWADFFGS